MFLTSPFVFVLYALLKTIKEPSNIENILIKKAYQELKVAMSQVVIFSVMLYVH